MDKKVLTSEEIQELKELKQGFFDLTSNLGNIEIQIMNLNLKKEQLKSNLIQLQEQEQVLANQLEEKYGKGSISLETGEFLPLE
jgi:di/tripeptidase